MIVIVIALVLSVWATPVLAGPPPGRSEGPRPVVVRAEVDRLEPDRLVIHGTNFGVSSAPVVLLSRIPLEVLSFSDEQIVAKLPIDAPPARYRLQVLAHGTSASAFVDVIVGRRPGRGLQGRDTRLERGPPGPARRKVVNQSLTLRALHATLHVGSGSVVR
jgi:hypothetical protein